MTSSSGANQVSSSKKKKSIQHRPRSLSHGRPKRLSTSRSSLSGSVPRLSSRTTRTVIRKHHQLSKSLSQAVGVGDTALAASLEAQISENGGLKDYQAASIAGQSAARGGDTSKKLLAFLDRYRPQLYKQSKLRNQFNLDTLDESLSKNGAKGENGKYKVLDVGALSTSTALSTQRHDLFSVTRIDLNSQEAGIAQQDFMKRPLSSSDAEKFDLICLSLVLNYVPDPRGRGEMLKRVSHFLLPSLSHHKSFPKEIDKSASRRSETKEEDGLDWPFPALFLVLPAPCVTNSRYLTLDLLTQMMNSLGYTLVEEQISLKLVYTLWRWHVEKVRTDVVNTATFKKIEVNPGKNRNNFAITLE